MAKERLVASAIRRNGQVSNGVKGAHWEVRAALGDDNPQNKQPGDEEGFLTSDGRFVNRFEAHRIACASGQTTMCLKHSGQYRLLSCDVTSWA